MNFINIDKFHFPSFFSFTYIYIFYFYPFDPFIIFLFLFIFVIIANYKKNYYFILFHRFY